MKTRLYLLSLEEPRHLNPKLPNKEYFKGLFDTEETKIMFSAGYDKGELAGLGKMFLNDDISIEPFKSFSELGYH
jgi:hypothetical protein